MGPDLRNGISSENERRPALAFPKATGLVVGNTASFYIDPDSVA